MAIERSASRLIRPFPGRRACWFLGAWLAPALALGGCRAPLGSQFEAAAPEPAGGAALVALRLDRVPRDSLVLQAFASTDFMRVALSVRTEDGRALFLIPASQESMRSIGMRFQLPRAGSGKRPGRGEEAPSGPNIRKMRTFA
jgi:hypothetical protein